jgi:SAM-dependent methyltransferase
MCEAIAETQRTYDLIAAEFARRTAAAGVDVVEQLDSFASSLPAGSLVADIGCGPGRDARLLGRRGLRVVGVDLSIGQLRAARFAGVVQADMRRLPLLSGCVDGIWCQAALLHIPRRDVPGVLAEFGRVVRSGGGLHVSVAEGDGEGFEVASNYASERRRWFTYTTEADLTRLLVLAGFAVNRIRRVRTHRAWLSVDATRTAAKR